MLLLFVKFLQIVIFKKLFSIFKQNKMEKKFYIFTVIFYEILRIFDGRLHIARIS